MITAIVQFRPANPLPPDAAADSFEQSAPRFQALDGLVRKYFLYEENGVSGGVYLWNTREEAEAYFDEAWKDRMEGQFGDRPEVTYFDSPVIVDNASGEISRG